MGTIEIPLSKNKLAGMLVGAIAFVGVGLWFIIAPPPISNPYFGSPTRLLFLGVIAILFFGVGAIYIIRKLQDKRPGLIMDQLNLVDRSSGASAGPILWSDIVNIEVVQIHRQRLIVLEVKNPEYYINKQTSVVKRRMMQANYKMFGSPISITPNTLQIKFDDLMKLLTNGWQASRA